ncbi:glycosyl hydrolase [Chryseobacterium sp.]|uniref:WD40/YVTN/BNR-like repeat-containing protein n=1 Tax=Chryseobacterium sp. TaxID=1871047 RepID=UPI00289B4009|nr:glycosyl hydrolase [Chryseobacterium sp.]
MKKLITISCLVFSLATFAQKIESFETILDDKISIRALEISDSKVWYSGTDSKFGYVDLKNPENKKQISLSDRKLQFRTLAQDANSFFAINIESPAQFFKIDKKTLKHSVVYKDTAKTAFYDALYFHKNKFYAFSDPTNNLNLKFLQFNMNKSKFLMKNYSYLSLNKGEAAFAASNTNISASENFIWIATGGNSSRIFRLNLKNEKLEAFETPFIQGISSQGIYSIDFSGDKFGIAVGGDYLKQDGNINNIATSVDAGKTWQIQASGNNAGYTTCVKIKPGSKGKEIISVGDQHISYSSDFGKTWKKISDEKGFFVCKWIDQNTVVFAGKDKIVKAKIVF